MATCENMTQEQKAKAYDEAIEKAKIWQEHLYDVNDKDYADELNYIFPELKESEGERMVKFIKKQLFNIKKTITDNYELDAKLTKAIDWLEKQGEQKPNYNKELKDVVIAELSKYNSNDLNAPWATDSIGLQYPLYFANLGAKWQGEQKPADTDFSDLRTWKYIVDAVWTEKEGIGQYLDSPFTEEIAKKLQKRFGNIEQKPEWSEEDNIILSRIIADYERSNEEWFNAQKSLPHGRKITWLKSLKDRIPPKHEWSEEDATHYNRILKELNLQKEMPINASVIEEVKSDIIWLKSLRPQNRWKPSDEQITWLYRAADDATIDSRMKQILKELLSDLKKLREE